MVPRPPAASDNVLAAAGAGHPGPFGIIDGHFPERTGVSRTAPVLVLTPARPA
jgi:hypothetical protein